METQDLTRDLQLFARGDSAAAGRVFPHIYDTLRNLAHGQMAHQPQGHSLHATELVHEAYVKLSAGSTGEVCDRHHFLRLASRVMRHVLVDHARKKGCDKRRPPGERLLLDTLVDELAERSTSLPALDLALERLERVDELAVRIVEMRFVSGLSVKDTAHALGITPKKVEREWAFARAWLKRDLA